MELVMTQVEKNEGITSVISLEEGFMNGLQYSGRLTQAKTKALRSHGKNAQGFMLEKSVVQSYTMVMNGSVMVDGNLRKDSRLLGKLISLRKQHGGEVDER